MKKRTLDLNNPDDAREYLLRLERRGKLEFDDGKSTVMDMSDDNCVAIAAEYFMRFHKKKGKETEH